MRAPRSLLLLATVGSLLAGPLVVATAACGEAHEHTPTGEVWTCPMHPSVRQDRPGTCPICKMDLVKVTADAATAGGDVVIDAKQRALAGVRTVAAARAPLLTSIKAPGRVGYDETRLRDVSLRAGGWIVDLLVDQPGLVVRAGQPLFTLSAPELAQAQAEHLRAMESGDAALARASRSRLGVLGLAEAQIAQLEEKRAALDPLPILSPVSGVVVEKDIVAGARVEPGARLLRLARLDRVWIEADVFATDAARVTPGLTARLHVGGVGAREAKVARVLPGVDGGARTARVRVDVDNADASLRPGAVVEVEIVLDAMDALLVPAGAVLYTGPRRVVFVESDDAGMVGGGRFVARTVKIGRRGGDDHVEIVSGLKEGERVVVDGAFLLASESRLRAPGALDHAGHDGGTP